MIVKNSDDAHEIVNKNPELSWEGWTIVRTVQDDYAEYLAIGTFNREDGRWYRKEKFPLHEFGWDIPDSVVRDEE
jgi:hypothetical protein